MKRENIIIKKYCTNLKCVKSDKIMLKTQGKFLQTMAKKSESDRSGKNSTENDKKSKKKSEIKHKFLLLLCGGIIGFLNGFFGGGGGMICVPLLQKSLKLDAKCSHATAIAVIFPLSLISASIYVFNGYIDSFPLISIGLGVVVGGIIGAFALKFLPPKAVRIIFALIMFIGGIKLII